MRFIDQYTTETYEQQQLLWLADLFSNIKQLNTGCKSIMLDLGSYQGAIIDVAYNWFDFVIGFEPHPASYQYLHKKYQDINNIDILQLVVDQTNLPEVQFTISHNHPASSYLVASPIPKNDHRHNGDHQVIKLPSVSVDSFMEDQANQLLFLKIDCEGHDFAILQGSSRTLITHRPLVLFEFGGKVNGDNYGYSGKEWYQFFKDHRYKLISPIGGHDERFICSHYAQHTHDLVDILAIPNEQYDYYMVAK